MAYDDSYPLRTLFVGGEFDGRVMGVLDFRESSTPDGYCAVETWAQVEGEWERMDEHGRKPGTSHRLDVVFATGVVWTNARIMQAMAKGLGVGYEYAKAGVCMCGFQWGALHAPVNGHAHDCPMAGATRL